MNIIIYRSRLGSLKIPDVAAATIEAIKMEKTQVVIPGYMFYLMESVRYGYNFIMTENRIPTSIGMSILHAHESYHRTRRVH